jgi:hypothetical protein
LPRAKDNLLLRAAVLIVSIAVLVRVLIVLLIVLQTPAIAIIVTIVTIVVMLLSIALPVSQMPQLGVASLPEVAPKEKIKNLPLESLEIFAMKTRWLPVVVKMVILRLEISLLENLPLENLRPEIKMLDPVIPLPAADPPRRKSPKVVVIPLGSPPHPIETARPSPDGIKPGRVLAVVPVMVLEIVLEMILVENYDLPSEIKEMIDTVPEETALEEIAQITGAAIVTVSLVVNMAINTAIEAVVNTIRNTVMDTLINSLAMAIARQHPV